MRPENDRVGPHPSHIPRPVASYATSRPPIPMQLSSPPRTHQYKSRPVNPNFRQPISRHNDRSANVSNIALTTPQYADRQNMVNQPHRSRQPLGRQLSHISAVSQAESDSRPLSENFIVSPSLTSAAVSEMGEEEDYNSRSVPHSRGGSQGRRTKATTPGRSRMNSAPTRDSETLSPPEQAATMQALTTAIRQGLHTTPVQPQPTVPKAYPDNQSLRMPFQGEPGSPSSVYTDVTVTNKRFSAPLSVYQGYDARNSKPLNVVQPEVEDDEDLHYSRDIPTPMSSHPIMTSGPTVTHSTPPAAARPLRLDIAAVREAEARGSMTSLSDLIRRATRLASNLDRGKTASRLGYLDMFGSSDKLDKGRGSTYSDVLDAFPPPAHGTGANTPRGGRPTTMWPNGEKQHMASKSSLGRFVEISEQQEQSQPKRKCCGLSPIAFVIVMIIVLLLVAAAVIVPVFLLLVLPKQHKTVNLADCHSTHACHNGGYIVTADNMCSCICVDGFTGADCSSERDPECVSATIADGDRTYDNATIGSSVLPLLQTAQTAFGILLNETIVLSQFAYNNLSCASENSLVDFGNKQPSAQAKRFVIIPGMMNTEPHIPVLGLPPSGTRQHPRFVIVDGMENIANNLPLTPTHSLKPRQGVTQSANGIVFATATATATGTGSTSAAATATGSPSSSNKIEATDSQLDFAAIVVLYVLQTSDQISNAVTANQAILTFFQSKDQANSTVEVMGGTNTIQANFKTFQIEFSNGTTIGGGGSST